MLELIDGISNVSQNFTTQAYCHDRIGAFVHQVLFICTHYFTHKTYQSFKIFLGPSSEISINQAIKYNFSFASL
jgi:hypothetical protein